MSGTSQANRAARLTGWPARTIWLVSAADVAIMIVLAVYVPRDLDVLLFATLVAMIASFGFVGALVTTRQPGNPIGWIVWLVATLVAIAFGGSDYAGYSAEHLGAALPGTVPIAWLSSWLFVVPIGLALIFVPLLFPDGHPPSPRWRPVAWFGAVAIVGAALVAFRPGPLSNVEAIQNPFGVSGLVPIIDAIGFPPGALLGPAILMALASTVVRFRHGGPVERRQLKWFSAVVFLTFLVFAFAPDEVSFFGIALLPIGIGIAVLRYRLYEIDRIVSRTLSYLIVTGVLAVVFVGAVLVSRAVLGQFLGESPVGVAASTLIVAALFQPLRTRVQRVVDRRFNRAGYDAERTVVAFTNRLRDQVDLAAVRLDLVATVEASLRPTRTGVWLRDERDATDVGSA